MHPRIVSLSTALSLAALTSATPAAAAPERAAATEATAATTDGAGSARAQVTLQAASGTTPHRAAPVSERRLVTAAGSVLVLADGVVVQARFAQIVPPAPGFVYER